MRRVEVVRHGSPLETIETEIPRPRGSEVLLRVTACGVCHSDVHYWRGGYELGGGRRLTLAERGIHPPMVLGHEPLGEVVEVGPDARDVPIGSTRLVYPWIGCGECDRCAAGNDPDCSRMRTIGLFRPGAYATHLIAPDPRYLLDPGGLPDEQACTLACAGLTALTAIRKVPPLYPNDAVVVIGVGGVGLTAVGMGATEFDSPLVAVDLDAAKAEAAKRAGARNAVVAGRPDTATEIADLTGGGAGAVLDFVGSEESARLGLECLRKGGRFIAVGLFGGELRFPLPLFPVRNISVIGSLVGTIDGLRDVLDWVREHGFPPVPVEVRSLDDATRSLEDLEAGRVAGRIVLSP